MNYLLTAKQMKIAEENAVRRGLSLRNLAENAARACFGYINRITAPLHEKTFVVLCGGGMNGGDGILLATLLRQAGAEVLCVFVGDYPQKGLAGEIGSEFAPALITAVYSGNEEAVKRTIQNTHVIIDCVFGTGFRGEFDYKVTDLLGFVNIASKALKISADLPSGVNADTGERAENAFIPDVTLISGAYKKGLLSQPCRDYCGEYVLMDIGLIDGDFTYYEAKFTDEFILSLRPERSPTSHKGSFGRLLNIAGSERYIGAALLSTKAAVKTGAGIVTLAAPEKVVSAIAHAVPEAVFTHPDLKSIAHEMQTASAVAIGCGLGVTGESRKITEYVIKNASCPVILDADGINSISDNINVVQDNANLILTPHPAEFARLTGLPVAEIQSNRIDYAKLFAKESGAFIVLKGVNTVIAAPDGSAFINPTGNAGLAKAGTGDVLTGMIASLAAQGVKPFEAAVLGVYMHGFAADKLAETQSLSSITASEIVNIAIP